MKLTSRDFGVVTRSLDKNLTLRINQCGNVTLKDRYSDKVVFVISRKADGYRIMKRHGWDNPYGSTHHYLNAGKPFATAKEMMGYFTEYRKAHPEWCRG